MAMSGCVAGAGDRSSLPQRFGRTSTTVSPPGRPRASTSIRWSESIVGTEDRGIPGADFSVVLADSVAEDDTKSIVVRLRRQPTKQPFASLGVPEAPLRSPRVLVHADPIAPDRSGPIAEGLREL